MKTLWPFSHTVLNWRLELCYFAFIGGVFFHHHRLFLFFLLLLYYMLNSVLNLFKLDESSKVFICWLLTAVAGMERFAFKGVASNLVTYLTDIVNMNNSAAAKTVNSWCGFTSMLPLLIAPLADSYWHRYSTIVVSSVLYVVVCHIFPSFWFCFSKPLLYFFGIVKEPKVSHRSRIILSVYL